MKTSASSAVQRLILFGVLGVCASVSAQTGQDKRKSECLAAYAEAQEQRMQGALLESREQLVMCTRDDCPKPIIDDCSEWLREVEADLSSVVFAVSDEGGHDIPAARVLLNGKPVADNAEGRAQLLDPGSYEFKVEATGFSPAQGTIVMHQSEKNRIVRVQLLKSIVKRAPPAAALTKADSDSGFIVPVASVVLGATALVGVASFAYFGLSGQDKRADAESCSMDCAALIDSGKRDYIIADISLGVAVVAAGSALLIAVLDQKASPPTTAQVSRAQLAVGAGHVALDVSF